MSDTSDPGLIPTLRRVKRRVVASTLAGNAAALYGAHFAGMIAPLVTIPWLARVLRPEGWGLVVFAQSLAGLLTLLLEYGFELSGTREVARNRRKPGAVAGVVAGVQGAKALIFVGVTAVAVGLFLLVPLLRENPLLFFWTWAFAVTRGFSPFWYFVGTEEMKGPAALEATGRLAAALGIFLWVTGTGDGWKVLALQAGTSGAVVLWMTARMYAEQPFRMPRWADARQALEEGAGVFIFRSSSGLYIQANAFILGLVAAPPVVAFFGAAEKLIRAAVNLLQPVSQVLYPRVSHLVVQNPEKAGRLLKVVLGVVGGMGVIMGATAALAAPWLVPLILGPGYEAAVPVLRVLALLPPVIAVGTVFGIHWALPLGLDRPFYRLVLAAGLLNVGLAFLLASRFGAMGMAVSVVVADSLVAAGLVVLFLRNGGLGAMSLEGVRVTGKPAMTSRPAVVTGPEGGE